MATTVGTPVNIGQLKVQLTAEELERRKEWLELGPEDEARLAELNELATPYAEEIIEDLYEHLLAHPETRMFFEKPGVLEYVKDMPRAYFRRLTQENYDVRCANERLQMGVALEQIGLDVKWYLAAYSLYLRAMGDRIARAYEDDPRLATASYTSLEKLAFLDMGLAIDTYILQREQGIRGQQEAQELPTPVRMVREGLLILPITGTIDSRRARQLTEHLLQSIRSTRAKVVVVDITEVPTVDTQVANHLVQSAEAARLMGATTIVAGLSAEVAQTLVTVGVDLEALNTVADLKAGIDVAEHMLGYAPILRLGDHLIVSLQPGLTDSDFSDLHDELAEQVTAARARGVILDLSALDVVDSFAARTLRTIAETARLRGARTVVVGIQPDVAFAMVQLGITFDGVVAALDLEEGLAHLGRPAASGDGGD